MAIDTYRGSSEMPPPPFPLTPCPNFDHDYFQLEYPTQMQCNTVQHGTVLHDFSRAKGLFLFLSRCLVCLKEESVHIEWYMFWTPCRPGTVNATQQSEAHLYLGHGVCYHRVEAACFFFFIIIIFFFNICFVLFAWLFRFVLFFLTSFKGLSYFAWLMSFVILLFKIHSYFVFQNNVFCVILQ